MNEKGSHLNGHDKGRKHYKYLLMMILLSFVSMYVFMYSMVDSFSDVYANRNQFYMAGVMTAPMVLIELFLMREMYSNRKWNTMIVLGTAAGLVIFFAAIRQQAGISDKQFLRSMIPHHSGAILMCEKAPVENPEIKKLCETIIAGQRSEIDQMKALLQK